MGTEYTNISSQCFSYEKLEKQKLRQQSVSPSPVHTEFLLGFPDTKKSLLDELLPAVCTVPRNVWLKGVIYRYKTCSSDPSQLTSSASKAACINTVELYRQFFRMFWNLFGDRECEHVCLRKKKSPRDRERGT